MSEEERKAIKILDDYIERKRATRTVYNTEDIIFDNIIILLSLLEKQTEIEERNKSNYITKDKIREKIKELDKEYKEIQKRQIEMSTFMKIAEKYKNKKDILEELLEEN